MNTDDHHTRIVLQRTPSEVTRARREVATACAGLGRDTVATAQLLASELVTNALDHGRGEITLRVARLPGELRVDVTDADPEPPRTKTVNPQDVRGRGLMILEALAARWGVETLPNRRGKSVWFTLRTTD